MRRFSSRFGWARRALGALGAALGAGACGDATAPGGAAVEAAVIPLAVGTRWTYAQVDSVELDARPFSPATRAVSAARDTVVAGRRGTVLDGGGVLFGSTAGRVIVAVDRAGVSTAEPEVAAAGLGPWLLTLAYPAAVGAGTPGGWRVTAVDTTVTVPAGTFRCVRYDLPGGDRAPNGAPSGPPIGTVLLAPGTGVVFSTYGRLDEIDPATGPVVGRHRLVFRLARLAPPGA